LRRFGRRHYTFLWVELLLVTVLSGVYGMANRTADEPYREAMAYSGSGWTEAAKDRGVLSARTPGPLRWRDLAALPGMTRAELLSAVGEPPVALDEGGLGFVNAGIRVWFDSKTQTRAAQVLVMSDGIDLNGVRLGDGIAAFRKVFGEPLSDRDGDARFAYGNIYLSVHYDASIGKTIAVYLLSENF